MEESRPDFKMTVSKSTDEYVTSQEVEKFKENFTGWEKYYKETKVEDMPWYEKNLDHDLENEIKSKNLNKGKFLDLGTGPATQAMQLEKYNFEITATGISQSAIKNAKKLSNEIHFLVDDILNSKLSDKEFDYIFDRGIFHVFDVSQRPQYVKQIKRILGHNGILFLKCMSINEKNIPDDGMPHKLSKQEIMDSFNDDFDIQRIDDTVFLGAHELKLKSLFAVMEKKSN